MTEYWALKGILKRIKRDISVARAEKQYWMVDQLKMRKRRVIKRLKQLQR